MKAAPMAGRRFGRLVVVVLQRSTPLKKYWRCACDCGGEAVSDGEHLRSGRTVSCGCVKRENAHAAGSSKHVHGHSTAGGTRNATREYRTWRAMHERCTNPKHKSWKDYGGRGIRVCERWASFGLFLQDMGYRPAGQTIDREKVNGNYEPGNCRWADRFTQANNTRRMAALNAARSAALGMTA